MAVWAKRRTGGVPTVWSIIESSSPDDRAVTIVGVCYPRTLSMRTRIINIVIVLLLTWCLPAGGKVNPVTLDNLFATPEQKKATELITHFIRRYHYRNKPLDDELSKAIYDRYLGALDPNRSYFLGSDINQFDKYRFRLDDAIRDTKLKPAFIIFKRLRRRLQERVDYVGELLEDGFDFRIDENFMLDRSKARWADGRRELNEIWRKRIKNDVLGLRLTGKSEDEIQDTLKRRYQHLLDRIAQFTSEDVYQTFINAYTASVEPHTSYFSRRASENFKIRMSLSLEGIGAALQSENEYTIVRRIIAGGPADQSGLLQVDDRITGVAQDDESITDVIGWRLADVVDLIRGPKGTVVRLEILPKGTPPEGPTKTIALVRNKIKLEEQAAKKTLVNVDTSGGIAVIGVIRVPAFYTDFEAREQGQRDFRSTTRDVRRLLQELLHENVDGVLVDLRGNGGGSLAEATELTGLFIRSGPIVQVRDSTGRVSVNDDPDPDIVYAGPLAVLVDRQSASASEIFAGAIQDYRRGIVIGEPTYGKGTVQRLVNLDRYAKSGGLGQLKFTIAQFFRINGASTQHRGVNPDIVFPTAMDIDTHGERALDNALPWASVRPARYIPGKINEKVIADARARHRSRIGENPGFMYLIGEAEAGRQARAKKTVTLEEAKRRANRDQVEQNRLTRFNRYRRARGLPPLKEVAETPRESSEDDDVLRQEAAQVLKDMIELSGRKLITLRP